MPPEIDLRSDTVTQPCEGMRAAMMEAPLGDDVICNDPTVDKLQQLVAEMLGKEAALFMPSGTMSNQVAIRCHCTPGDEFICETDCHIYRYEQGAFAQLSGLVPKLLHGNAGILELEQFQDTISPVDDHALSTRLVTLENTHNRGGGTIQPLENVNAICTWAHDSGLSTHLDGARLFNAVIASGVEPHRWAENFDSISVCFSKGLGAPVGSALVGSRDFIQKARRARKLFGGGMRQAGVLAAAAIYALENNVDRLEEDHDQAMMLASIARNVDGVSLDRLPETNIVLLRVAPEMCSPAEFVEGLGKHGVGAFPFGKEYLRLVTHKDVSDLQIRRACEVIKIVAESIRG